MTTDAPSIVGSGIPALLDTPADVKLGLVGYGRWGRKWARVLSEMGVLHWIVDTDESTRARARYEHPGVSVHAELPPWELAYMSGAVVATPPAHHAVPTLELLSHGVPVLVEKPMALSVEDAEAMTREAHTRVIRMMVDHTFLASKSVQIAAGWAAQDVGTVRHARYFWQNRSTGNAEDALWNLGPHPLSICLAMATARGTDVREFVVKCASTKRPDVLDAVDLTLYMEDGSLETLYLSNFGPEKVREFAVTGTEGSLVCRPTQGEAVLVPHRGEQTFQQTTGEEPLKVILRQFLDPAPLGDECGQDALRMVRILNSVSDMMKELVHG